jgi:type I restriction enzyme M protein
LRAGWFFDSAEEQMRDALVKAGVIEAVISLGAGLLPSTGIPCGLLILRKSGVVNRPVRFVDASEAGRTVRGKRTLSHVEIDTIVNAVNGDWDQDSTSKVYVKDVSVAEIIANSASLQTSRYLTTEEIQLSVEDAINAFQSAKSDLEETLAAYKSAVEKSTQFQRYADSLSSDRPAEQVLVEALSRPNSPRRHLPRRRCYQHCGN